MIKSERGEVDLKGSVPEIKADLCIAIKAVREGVLAEVYGAEEAEKEIEHIVEDSKKNESDIEKEIKANLAEVLEILLRNIGSTGSVEEEMQDGECEV